MAEPNEITLLFTHTLLGEEKKSPPRLICMCPSNLRLHCIPCLLPVRILCFNRCLFMAEKLINPNACLTKFENTKKQSCAQPDCLHVFASHMCNYNRRWQINYLLGLCVTVIYNVLGCDSKSKKSGGMGEETEGASEGGEEMGQERVSTESNFSYPSCNFVASNINDATALNKQDYTEMCCLYITPLQHANACNKFRKFASNTHNMLRLQKWASKTETEIQKQIKNQKAAHPVDTRNNYSGQKVFHPPCHLFSIAC